MTEPNAQLLDGSCTVITIAGKEWPIPLLAPKQNRIVVPTLLEILPPLIRLKGKDGKLDMDKASAALSTDVYDKLSTCIFLAMQRGTPTLTRQEYDDMPIGPMEMLGAMIDVARQTGIIKPAAKPGAVPSGEAEAGNSQTGTS